MARQSIAPSGFGRVDGAARNRRSSLGDPFRVAVAQERDPGRGAQAAGDDIRTLPGLMDLAHGRVTVNDLRELDIEDILGRDVVPPNQLLLGKNIAGKTVLVTGAGGSIGSELCRQIVALRPTTLLLVEQSEYNLYAIDQELGHLVEPDGEGARKIDSLARLCPGQAAPGKHIRYLADRHSLSRRRLQACAAG